MTPDKNPKKPRKDLRNTQENPRNRLLNLRKSPLIERILRDDDTIRSRISIVQVKGS